METMQYKKQTIFWDKEGACDFREIFGTLGCKKVFAVCSKGATERYGKRFFEGSGVDVTWFGQFSSNPLYEDIKEGTAQFQNGSYDAIISIGGGSTIDVAKCILAFLEMDQQKDYLGQEIQTAHIPHLAVPTTAGTGSESTHFAVIYAGGEKRSVSHEGLLPDYALLEPAFLESLPVYQKKCTVLDALCQAIESYWSVNSTDESKGYAKEAIDVLLGSILPYVTGNSAMNARVIRAANLAGRAIDISRTTAAHAMSYKLSSLYGIPHGHAVAVCLPYTWEMLLSGMERCVDVRGQDYLKSVVKDITEYFGTDSAEQAILRFKRILESLDIHLNDCKLGDYLSLLVCSVNPERLENFPIHLEKKDLEQIYRRAFAKADVSNVAFKEESAKGRVRRMEQVKRAVMEKTRNRPVLAELFRKLLECKRRVTYTVRYKYRFSVDDKIVLFESYHGDHYNCNPRGIYEAMLKDERYLDYTFVWAFKDPERYKFLEDNFSTVVVKSTSKRYYKYCASAKYIVLNLLLRPQLTLKREQTYIQTWHGKPIKTIGCSKRFETDPRRRLKDNFKHFSKNGKRITKLLSPSDFFSPIMGAAFDFDRHRKNGNIVETGYPRNDALFAYTEEEIAHIRQRLGIDPKKTVILYAPTWRELFSDYLKKEEPGTILTVSESLDFAKLREELGEDCLILFRAHHLDAQAMNISRYGDFIVDVTDYENVNDLYIISDLMISDYSGTIFDFGLLKRPMVFYMFDRKLYTTKLQGVNIDLDELPGIIVEKEDELASAVKKQLLEFQYDEKYREFNQKYNQYDDGYAGQRVIDLCMPDNVIKKTITLQAVKKFIMRNTLFVMKPLKRLKLNCKGLLREKGIIRDENTKKLLALKEKYKGQRCFLVGNGPSLTAEDLDMIADEVSFGCNMVYKMFDKTKWRPTYHFIVDIIYTKNLYMEITDNIKSPMITHNIAYRSMKQKPENIMYVDTFSQEDYQIRGNMLAYYIPARATVMSFMIEMAMYMGFKEIFLLGTDCTNSFTSGHFGGAYVASDLDKVNLARARRTIGNPRLTLAELGEYRRERSVMAYEKIAQYAKEKNVKIYNTTRGGELEVFPRRLLEAVVGSDDLATVRSAQRDADLTV